MTRLAVLSFDNAEGEGKVRFLPAYNRLVRSERLDALLEWIGTLQREYDTILGTPPTPPNERGIGR